MLATGDLFRADEDGFLYFVGRRDDIIKSRGEKVAPREVEEVLHAVPGCARRPSSACPTGCSARRSSRTSSAEPGAELDPAALRRHCAGTLEDHMVPQRVVVHDELPRIGSGKIDRRALAGWSLD